MRRPVSLGASVRTTVSTSGSSGTRLRVDQDVVPFHLDREAIQLDRRVEIVLAGAAIVRPLVPRTGDDTVREYSLADRAACVWTNSPQRMQLTVVVTDRVRV